MYKHLKEAQPLRCTDWYKLTSVQRILPDMSVPEKIQHMLSGTLLVAASSHYPNCFPLYHTHGLQQTLPSMWWTSDWEHWDQVRKHQHVDRRILGIINPAITEEAVQTPEPLWLHDKHQVNSGFLASVILPTESSSCPSPPTCAFLI